jgi:hypothetical protein
MMLPHLMLTAAWLVVTGVCLAIGFWIGNKATRAVDEMVAAYSASKAESAIPVPGL